MIRGEDYAKLEELIKVLPNLANNDKLQLAKNVLAQIDGDDSTSAEFASAFQGTNEQTLRHIATAARLIQYRRALEELKAPQEQPVDVWIGVQRTFVPQKLDARRSA